MIVVCVPQRSILRSLGACSKLMGHLLTVHRFRWASVYTARAYFLSCSESPEYLIKAEATLHELITSIDTSVDKVGLRLQANKRPYQNISQTSAEYQQLRWMRIAVMKRRKAAFPVLLEGTFYVCLGLRMEYMLLIPHCWSSMRFSVPISHWQYAIDWVCYHRVRESKIIHLILCSCSCHFFSVLQELRTFSDSRYVSECNVGDV